MTRMSEVFKLPVDGYALRDTVFYKTSGADDEIIAHAINNVDTLDACVKVLGQMPAGEPVNDSDRAYYQALEAINAYRGTK